MTQPLGQFAAGADSGHAFALEEGDRMLRVRLDGGEMYAKQGSMVAYRGQMDFAYKGQGVGGLLRRAVSGEGQDLMRVRGRGIVWFAESGSHISVFHLDSDRLTVNGRNLLALVGAALSDHDYQRRRGRDGRRRRHCCVVPERGRRKRLTCQVDQLARASSVNAAATRSRGPLSVPSS